MRRKRITEQDVLDAYYMGRAISASKKATCRLREVGAVAVDVAGGVWEGWNDAPPGQQNCFEAGCILEHDPAGDGRCIRTLHAEQMSLAEMILGGCSPEGSVVYSTCRPCQGCSKWLARMRVKRVVYLGKHPEGWILKIFKGAGIILQSWKLKED